MKRILLLFLFLLLLPAWGAAETRIMVLSDIHHLPPELWEGSDIFLNALSRGDGKVTQYSTQVVQALVEEALEVRPDLVLITGDLTFNGETDSHRELAGFLRPITEAGIPVAVIPGNHDINNISAVQWLPKGFRTVESADSKTFREIWQGMLAVDMPGPGFSGVVRLADCWVAVGDYSIYEYEQAPNGFASAKHIAWMASVLEAAEETGVPVISASHQSMLPHTEYHDEIYRVVGAEHITDMLLQAGNTLNLSGHLHLQHIAEEGGFTDIATQSVSMYPHRWGLVTVSEGQITYEVHALADTRLTFEFTDTTRTWFRDAIIKKLRPALEELSLSDEELEAMLAYAGDMNLARFSGRVTETPHLWTDPGRRLWLEKAGDSAYARTLDGTLNGVQEDCLHWQWDRE